MYKQWSRIPSRISFSCTIRLCSPNPLKPFGCTLGTAVLPPRARELTSRQEQAALSFRQAISSSITADSESKVASQPLLEGRPPLPSTEFSDSNIGVDQDASTPTTREIKHDRGKGSVNRDESRQYPLGTVSKRPNILGRVIIPQHPEGNGDSNVIDTATASLTTDLCRLASRQGDDVCQVLEEVGSGINTGCCDFGDVPKTVTTLGRSVALQARAVGLMGEVLKMTTRSKVSQCGVNLSLFFPPDP